MQPRYLILDTETWGLGTPEPPASGVVEIAWLEVDPATLDVVSEFSSRVNPGCKIQPGASAIHGLSDEDVADAPTLGEVFNPDSDIVVGGHNSPFDLKFVGPYTSRITDTFCTLALARQYVRSSPNHKLQTLADHFGLAKGKAHSALGDVYTTLELLKVLVDLSGRPLPALVQAARKPKLTLVMPYGRHKGVQMHKIPVPYMQWLLAQDGVDQDLRYSMTQQLKVRT